MAYLTTPFTFAKVEVANNNGGATHPIADLSEIQPLIKENEAAAAAGARHSYFITLSRNGYEFSAEYDSAADMEIAVNKQKDRASESFVVVVAKLVYMKSTRAFKVKSLSVMLTAEDVLLTPDEISAQLEGVLAELRSVRAIAPSVQKGTAKATCRIVGSPQSAETAAGKKQFAAYKAAAKAQIVAFDMLAKL